MGPAVKADWCVQGITANRDWTNLNDEQLQRFYGTIGAEDTLKAMLNPGELTDLMLAVQEACGYNVGMKEEIKHVKNC